MIDEFPGIVVDRSDGVGSLTSRVVAGFMKGGKNGADKRST